MRKQVYLETTIVSYLTARHGRDLIRAARLEITREWWHERKGDFDIYISQFVLDEAAQGDREAAAERLKLLEGLPLLEANDPVVDLGEALTGKGVLPAKAATDALHIAVATVHEMDILLTWNCKHLANAEMLVGVVRLLRDQGYETPIVCTPDELMGV